MLGICQPTSWKKGPRRRKTIRPERGNKVNTSSDAAMTFMPSPEPAAAEAEGPSSYEGERDRLVPGADSFILFGSGNFRYGKLPSALEAISCCPTSAMRLRPRSMAREHPRASCFLGPKRHRFTFAPSRLDVSVSGLLARLVVSLQRSLIS